VIPNRPLGLEGSAGHGVRQMPIGEGIGMAAWQASRRRLESDAQTWDRTTVTSTSRVAPFFTNIVLAGVWVKG
jgi:hypothetical protein